MVWKKSFMIHMITPISLNIKFISPHLSEMIIQDHHSFRIEWGYVGRRGGQMVPEVDSLTSVGS